MNVVLNPMEASAVLTLVTAQMIDRLEVSDEAKAAIRAWRDSRAPGSAELDAFVDLLNDALGTHIDEATRRRFLKGGHLVRATAKERAGSGRTR